MPIVRLLENLGGPFKDSEQENAEEQKAENERVVNETNEYARFVDELIRIFGGAQVNIAQDTSEITVSSKFNDTLKSEKIKDLTSKFQSSQGKPLQGLYALVLQKYEEEERATGLPPEGGGGTAWKMALRALKGNPAVKAVKGVASVADNIADGARQRVLGNNSNTSEISQQATENLKKLDFPQYYVFVLSNIGDNNPIPTLLEERGLSGGQRVGRAFGNNPPIQHGNKINSRKFTNIDNYPKSIITSKSMRDEEELTPGTLIRISYDSIDTTGNLIVSEIIESDPEFVELVMRGLGAKALLNAVIACQQDSMLTNVQHPTGDPIGTLNDVLTKTNIGGNNTIAYPFKENATVNLVVFLHGMFPYGGKTGQEILLEEVKKLPISSTMFLIPKGTTKGDFEWAAIEQAINDLTAKGITISSKRLGAWSAGVIGFNKAIQGAPDGYWNASIPYFLADPSPSTRVFGSEFEKLPNGVYMEYNRDVWKSTYPDLAAAFPKMAQKITTLGGQAKEETNMNHKQILVSVLTKLNT